MPRVARIVKPGLSYHVTQRGNFRQTVFEEHEDFLIYKEWLKEYSNMHMLEISAWCLMSNHVHFICIPKNLNSLSNTFRSVHTRYSQYFNNKQGRKGHLWQGRFFSCPLDDAHLYSAIRYVENNPARAGIVRNAKDYEWSSAVEHINNKYEIVSGSVKNIIGVQDWDKYLGEDENDEDLKKIRDYTFRGVPLGGEGFIAKLEKYFKKDLKLRNQGGQKKVVVK